MAPHCVAKIRHENALKAPMSNTLAHECSQKNNALDWGALFPPLSSIHSLLANVLDTRSIGSCNYISPHRREDHIVFRTRFHQSTT